MKFVLGNLSLVLVLAGLPLMGHAEQAATPAPAAATADADASDSSNAAPARRTALSPMDRRIALLAKELDLDARQQAEVRRILMQQRAEVNKAWSNESVPAAQRIAASRAIGDKTADRIRAILNDQQRENYIKPRRSMTEQAPPKEKVESWIDAVGKH